MIRVDADEITYNLHIVLRAEIEKLVLAGELKVSEVPEYWSNYMEELPGVKPRKHIEGVLQDVRWGMGEIGYFPAYALRNVIAASIRRVMEREVGLLRRVATGDFVPIREWLRAKIHRYGATYTPREMLRKALGTIYKWKHPVKYLEEIPRLSQATC